jgi:alpha-L-arabinofuranosidase
LEPQGASVEEVNGASVSASNSFEAPEEVFVTRGEIEKFRDGVTYTFPAHSMTVITFEHMPG